VRDRPGNKEEKYNQPTNSKGDEQPHSKIRNKDAEAALKRHRSAK